MNDLLYNIFMYKERQGISDKELAKELGFTSRMISLWRTEESNSYYYYVDKISKFLNVPIEVLFSKRVQRYESVHIILSSEEFELIKRLRSMPKEEREKVVKSICE